MAFQERFRKAYANWRKNPFTGTDLSQAKTENGLVIPSSSPYFIQLVEVPKKDSPSSVSVFNVTDNVQMTEVSTSPGQNQFRVDYPPPDGQGTGLVEFSSLDAGKTVNISYHGTGSPVVTEFLDTFMAHPLNEVSGDMYYFDGEVKRVGDAIDVTTKKLKSTILNPVDPSSTDTVKDKVISNALAKGWEDHRNAAAPHSGHETPAGAQSKVNTHSSATTGIHGVGASTVDSVAARNSAIETHRASAVHSAAQPPQAHGDSIHNSFNEVVLTSTDTTRNKHISNADGKNWEDHRNSKHEFATPIGSIVAWLGGYFTNSANGGYTAILGGANSIAGANSYLNPHGWYVCNGAALNDSASPIFNGTGRYLPNLTDSRFIMGSNTGGTIGGTNSASHSHDVGSYAISSVPDHSHSIGYSLVNSSTQSSNHTHDIPTNHRHRYTFTECQGAFYQDIETAGVTGGSIATTGVSANHYHSYYQANTPTGAAGGHTHNINGLSGTATLDNRPQFLTCFYIMRVR